MREKRKITAEDFYKMKFVSDPQISPAGNEIVYTLITVTEAREYQSQLYLLDTEGNSSPFTNTEKTDSTPRWSPRGDQVAFVSNRSGSNQLWLIHRGGGEATQLTHMYHGASSPVWSPDGKKIAFISAVRPEDEEDQLLQEKTEEDRKEEEKEKGKKARVYDNLNYKSDNAGFLTNKKAQIWVLDLESGEIERITRKERNFSAPAWSPDGKKLAMNAELEDGEYQPGYTDIVIVDVESKEMTSILTEKMSASHPSWSPLGDQIAFFGHDLSHKGATHNKIWIKDLNSGSLRTLAVQEDVGIGDFGMSDLRAGGTNPAPQWAADGNAIFAVVSQDGSSGIFRFGLDDSVQEVVGGERQIFGFSMDVDKAKIAFAFTTVLNPGDLALYHLHTQDEKILTDVNSELLAELELSKPEVFHFTGPDGWKVQGWMMKPAGFTENKKYPLVLEVHGGPHAMYSHSFFHEFQLLAAHGYGVVYCNPRGSAGYGQNFVDACRTDYGGKDYQDLMACVDYAIEKWDWINADQLGVTGGSYGGFMTNWIIGHTDRFKAAVTQRSITNWISFSGVSDIGYFFCDWEHNLDFLDHWEELIQISPLKYVKNINTPLLIIHSENDYRCPVEQAEQLYVALKWLKKPVWLSIFPGSNHNLSRNGQPSLRVERLNQIAEWFDKYLEA